MSPRPRVKFLDDELIGRILDEARSILQELGCTIHNLEVLHLLADFGADVDIAGRHVRLTGGMIDRALSTVPKQFRLYDSLGNETHCFAEENVYFTPGSAALHILDPGSHEIRRPTTDDYVRYVKLVSGLNHIASQSTAMIPADVVENVSDSYRLYLSLLFGEKPVVTGTFTAESFEAMKDFQLIVRGDERGLKDKPLCIFSCCPTSPLKWSDVTSQNVLDCARWGIPVEFISMPLSGFMAPVTLVGTLVAHTAETLSGIVISQLSHPGAPVLYGGSPAAFDIRYETTPMGAVETQMVDCAYNEIGHFLGIPTQAYISLSDAKMLDAQAGLESSMGATLAALAGINNVSGPGMLDFESCQSLEKLVLDNEICGMVLRMVHGIQPKEDFPALPIFQELLREKHLLISKHTRKYLKDEHYFPGSVIDRANLSRWRQEGAMSLETRAVREVERIIGSSAPSALSQDKKQHLTERMVVEARKHGMETLPSLPV